MFYSLSGKIQNKLSNAVIVDVHGIGFLVYTTLPILAKTNIGDDIAMYVYLHVREDQMLLAGFLEEDDLNIFKKVISVSGVGIKAGLAILSSVNFNDLLKAVEEGKVEIFEKVSGIGKKTAQKLILELRGKVDFDRNKEGNSLDEEATEALIRLGYTKKEAQIALQKVDSKLSLEDKIREALRFK